MYGIAIKVLAKKYFGKARYSEYSLSKKPYTVPSRSPQNYLQSLFVRVTDWSQIWKKLRNQRPT